MNFKGIVKVCAFLAIGFLLDELISLVLYDNYGNRFGSRCCAQNSASKIDAYVQQWSDLKLFSGSVLVTCKDKVVFSKDYDMYQSREGKHFGLPVIWHMDELVPCFANRVHFVDNDMSILILKKTKDGVYVESMSSDIAAIMLGKPYGMPQDLVKSIVLSDQELDEYRGRFMWPTSKNPLFTEITKEDSKLWMQTGNEPKYELISAAKDRFFLKNSPTFRFAFQRDSAGSIISFVQCGFADTDEMLARNKPLMKVKA
jgi:hypothetical protein